MKVYVLTSEKVIDGILFSYEPQVFKTRDKAREMLKRIRDEEYMPEYVEIQGFGIIKDDEDDFVAALRYKDLVSLHIDHVEVK